ncbi:uncharacterized protein KGF55_005631 [Candida pseudojiufengensis]|uniref:uncharacterized protein n=1 Tax=Candida pseudojiufengensis TaxID=497109 RepID=UPI0022259312|nr:uncharacterized protein KGF55_005631 [Candida pseudojiufengensis]KAI5958977.1 hypothetical protein KGF55_005631 [Candida pseudojiufengensis]
MVQNNLKTTHLPTLYNPLLNCIFNNPNHSKSPFKNVIEELKTKHNQYTILIPPAYILNEFNDPASDSSRSKIKLKDLCYYSEDFIKSHVIKTVAPISSTITPISKEQSVTYYTMNNKQILIKNRMIYTGKGFKRSLKLKITSISYVKSFCDYFPTGSQFMIIYIESSLIGGTPPYQVPTSTVQSNGSILSQEDLDTMTFEKLLRNFPLLSKAVSDKFYRLFHHNNTQSQLLRTRTRKQLNVIKTEFKKVVDEAFKIISDSVKVENPNSEQTYNIINHIVSIYPGIDFNKLVHEYVELNLYDVLWSQLIFQFNYSNDDKMEYDQEAMKVLSLSKYESLSCLSLNQMDLPIDKPWQMNELYSRIFYAIQELRKLADPSMTNSTLKTNIIRNTIEILSKSDKNLVIDADTLMGLLVMTVVHSKIDNLEAQIYYILNFNATEKSNDGQFNYIMSNLDAVICHVSSHDTNLLHCSQQNFELWSAVFEQNISKLKDMLSEIDPESDLPLNHFLKSKNISGESLINFAIKVKNFEIYQMIMENLNWFSIDFILFDKNVIRNQNLLVIALVEETDDEILDDLVSTILDNTTLEEQISYLNMKDNSGRTVGHYLFHKHKLIPRLSHLIDWEIKDHNSHTPLFSLCRCYDHPDYLEILKNGFDVVYEKYKTIDFDLHVDKSGNTLLHVILKGLPQTQILSNKQNLIDLNATNTKSLTPLMSYVKYSRLENLKDILQDERLDFMFEDNRNHYTVFDYLSFVANKSKSNNLKQIDQILSNYIFENYFPDSSTKLFVLNGKYDSNSKDWILNLKTDSGSKSKTLKSLKQVLYVKKLNFPMSTIPESEVFWRNYTIGAGTTPMFQKFRINKLIDRLNILFQSMVFQNIDLQKFYHSFVTDEEISVLDSKQRISTSVEEEKSKLGDVKLKSTQVQEMQTFLNFSLSDLNNQGQVLHKFIKLLDIGEQKQLDLKNVENLCLSRINNEEFFTKSFEIPEYDSQSASLGKLADYLQWIEFIGFELKKNIHKLLQNIDTWNDIFHHIRSINTELRLQEPPPPTEGEPALTKTRTNSSVYSVTQNNVQDNESEGFFAFGKTKKSKYKDLLLSKASLVEKLMKLNLDLKYEFELIATEISNFLKFKTNFLQFGIKIYLKEELINSRKRLLELNKVLYKIKN